MTNNVRLKVFERSGGFCEVIEELDGMSWRCNRQADDIHHMLTRARGGLSLDSLGETYHLIHLCRKHHEVAHRTASLYIAGYVTKKDQKIIYEGPDSFLRSKYSEPVEEDDSGSKSSNNDET